MNLLRVENISKRHDAAFLLNNINFIQSAGQRIAIAGEAGSGKTTLMRIIAGLGQADSGMVFFENQQVKGIDEKLMPGHKGIAYLSQHFELPNKYRVSELLNYANNLTDQASAKLYDICRIAHLLHHWTHTLSGGEKQRVALARLLTETPRLLLLDEPYSNLDLIHKLQLKNVIWDVGKELGISCILISHDADDMLPWADEILIMKEGNIVQQGNPQHIYQQPNSEYVAGLFGKYNIITGSLARVLNIQDEHKHYLRPEDLSISPDKINGIYATVTKVLYLGSHLQIEVLMNKQILTVNTQNKAIVKGMEVYVDIPMGE